MKVLDHENNENANSDAYDDPEIIISEKPIFDGSPLTLTMHVIAIIAELHPRAKRARVDGAP